MIVARFSRAATLAAVFSVLVLTGAAASAAPPYADTDDDLLIGTPDEPATLEFTAANHKHHDADRHDRQARYYRSGASTTYYYPDAPDEYVVYSRPGGDMNTTFVDTGTAQRRPGWNSGEAWRYDPAGFDTEFANYATLRGRVESFNRLRVMDNQPLNVSLTLRTAGGMLHTVVLGQPATDTGMLASLGVGDSVFVAGDDTRVMGRKVLQAGEIHEAGDYFGTAGAYDDNLSGRLERIREVHTTGNSIDAVLARVEEYDGDSEDVLIGSPTAWDASDTTRIRRGDMITVSGYIPDGRATLFATNISARDTGGWTRETSDTGTAFTRGARAFASGSVDFARGTARVVRRAPGRIVEVFNPSDTESTANQDYVTGEVDDLDHERINGERYVIAKVKTSDGRKVRVDLGPAREGRFAAVREDDYITASGMSEYLDGKQMLRAANVEIHGHD
jgi:hypothetical protein